MSFYSKETPTGVVDGSNKTFVLAHTILQVDDCWIDGAVYLGSYTIVDKTITFADAPQVSIYVDYYDTLPVPPVISSPGYITVNDAYNALLEMKKDLSDVPQATFIRLCDYINKFLYRFALGVDPGRFIKEYSFNAYNGQAVYALPTDFRDIAHFGTGIFYWDSYNNVATNRQLARTGYGNPNTGYFIQSTNINLTPPNWKASQTFVLRYIPTQSDLAFMGNYFSLDGTHTSAAIIPSEYLSMLVNILDVKYSQWDEVADLESIADARFTRELTEFAKELYKEASQYYMDDLAFIYS